MANIIVPVDGLKDWLAQILSRMASAKLRLYVNNYTPISSSLVGDFTEATFTGYVLQNGLSFGAIYVDGSNRAAADTPNYTFTFTGGGSETVYGYFTTDSTGTIVEFACRAPTPFVLAFPGDTVVVGITLTEKSEF